jgi:NitT/TauT family transport system substrate-binding protein
MLLNRIARLGVALALMASACGGSEGTAGGGGAEQQTIKMGMADESLFTAEWFGWMVADEMGYYEDLGLEVEFVPTGGSSEAVEQLAAGNLEAGNPSMPSVAEALLGGIPLVNIYTYSNGAIFGIFAPKDSGISSVAELGGKNIGISDPAGGEVAFLEAALRQEGIDPINDVTLIPIGEGGPETFQAIQSGRVDAYSSAYNDIFAMEVQAEELKLADLTPPEYQGFPARGIITTPEVLEEKSEELKRLALGTAMGTHFCFSDLKACEKIMRKVIPEIWEANAQGVSQGSLRYELAQKQVRPPDPSEYGAHEAEETSAMLETIGSTMEGASEVDLNTFLHDQFLEYANDFDREAVEADAADYKG